jgi:putative salt-induced outer membrane protein
MISLFLAFILPVFSFAEWNNKSEGGMVVTGGNSRTQSIQAKHLSNYKWELNSVSLSGAFLKGKSEGVLNAKKWDSTLRYERMFTDRFSGFLSQGVESDRFAGYLQRFNSDIGPKYFFLKEENQWNWFAEAGYRYTKERRTDGSRSSDSKARIFSEVSKKWNETSSSKLWVEYIPNFSTSKDWLFNAEASAEAALNSVLAFRFSYLMKYDNQPNAGAKKKTDSTLTTSLVANY